MEESDVQKREAPSPQLGHSTLVTSQPSNDVSTADEHGLNNLERNEYQGNSYDTVGQTHDETNTTDNSNSLHATRDSTSGAASPTGDKLNHSTNHISQTDDTDDVHRDIQRKMSGIIQNLQSPPVTPPRSANVSRHSTASHHSHRDEANRSSPVLADTSIKSDSHSHEPSKSPTRSRTGSTHVEHNPTTTVTGPVVDESSSEGETMYGIASAPSNTINPLDESLDQETQKKSIEPSHDDAFFDAKPGTVDDEHSSSNENVAPNVLDETTRFDPNSPKHPRSRAQSTTSKTSFRGVRDEASTHNERDHEETAQVDSTPARTDQEVKTGSRRSSATASISGRTNEHVTKVEPDKVSIHSKSNDQEQNISTHADSNETTEVESHQETGPAKNNSRVPSPTFSHHSNKNEDVQQESHTDSHIVPVNHNRAPSPTKSTTSEKIQSSTSARPNSTQSKDFPMSEERSQLIKTEEPINTTADDDTEHVTSLSPEDHQNQARQQSRPTTGSIRKGSIGGESTVSKEHESSQVRRASQASQHEQNVASSTVVPRTTPTNELTKESSGSRRPSDAKPSENQNDQTEILAVGSRRGSESVQHTNSQPSSRLDDVHSTVPQKNESNEQQKVHSRQPSTASQKPIPSKRSSVTSETGHISGRTSPPKEPVHAAKRESITSEHSMRLPPTDAPAEAPPSSRRSSQTSGHIQVTKTSSQKDGDDASRRSSPTGQRGDMNKVTSSTPGSAVHSRKPSETQVSQQTTSAHTHIEGHDDSQKFETKATVDQTTADDSTDDGKKSPVQRSSFAFELPTTNKRLSNASQHSLTNEQQKHLQQDKSSRTGSIAEATKSTSKRPSTTLEHIQISSTEKHVDEHNGENEASSDEIVPNTEHTTIAEIEPVQHENVETHDHKDVSRRSSVKSTGKPASTRPSTSDMEPVETHDQKEASRRSSVKPQSKPASKRPSASDIETVETHDQKDASRRSSVKPESKPASKRPSTSDVEQVQHEHVETHDHKDASRRSSVKPESKPASKRPSAAEIEHVETQDHKEASRRSSVKSESKPASKRPSASEIEHEQQEHVEIHAHKDASRHSSAKPSSKIASKRPSAAEVEQVEHEHIENDDHVDVSSYNIVKAESKPPSKRPSVSEIEHVQDEHTENEDHKAISSRNSVKAESKPASKRPSATDIEYVEDEHVETHDNTEVSRRSSVKPQSKPASKRPSTSEVEHVQDEHSENDDHKPISSRSSIKAGSKATSKRPSAAEIEHVQDEHSENDDHKPISSRSSIKAGSKATSKRPSAAEIEHVQDEHSENDDHKPISSRSSVKAGSKATSKRPSAAEIEHVQHEHSENEDHKPISSHSSVKAGSKPASKRPSAAEIEHVQQQPSENEDHDTVSIRSSIKAESKAASTRPSASDFEHVQHEDTHGRDQKVVSSRSSVKTETKHSSKRPSATESSPVNYRETEFEDQKVTSRKSSVKYETKPPSKRPSASEVSPLDHRDTGFEEQKASSRKSSVKYDSKPSSKRPSASELSPVDYRHTVVEIHKSSSRKSSVKYDSKPSSKRPSAGDVSPLNYRDADADDQKVSSRKSTSKHESKPTSKRPSGSEFSPIEHKHSSAEVRKDLSHHSSAKHESRISSKHEHKAAAPVVSSRVSSDYDDGKLTSQMSTPGREYTVNKRPSIGSEQNPLSSDDVFYDDKRGHSELSSRTDKIVANQHETHSNHQHHSLKSEIAGGNSLLATIMADQPATPSDEHEARFSSHHDSQRKTRSSHRSNGNVEDHSASPARSVTIQKTETPDSVHHDNLLKIPENKQKSTSHHSREPSQDLSHKPTVSQSQDKSRQSSFHVLGSNTVYQSYDKREKSREEAVTDTDDHSQVSPNGKHSIHVAGDKQSRHSPQTNGLEKRSASLKRGSSNNSKKNSTTNAEETTVIPIHIDSYKGKNSHANRVSTAGSDNESTGAWKLPAVNSIVSNQNGKSRPTEPIKRLEIQQSGGSRATTISDDESKQHWTKQIPVPSIQWDGDEIVSTTEDQPRPQSPNVNQIAERNPVKSPTKVKTETKSHDVTDGQKRIQISHESASNQHQVQRNTSADVTHHIRLVDDDSLDSGSEHNVVTARGKRRSEKKSSRDASRSKDQADDSRERGSSKHTRIKKSGSEHTHSKRGRRSLQDQCSSTPETNRDDLTSGVRSTVTHFRHVDNEKDPINVKVTVVVKKCSGHASVKTPRSHAETFVEDKSTVTIPAITLQEQTQRSQMVETMPTSEPQVEEAKPEQYFDHVPHVVHEPEDTAALNSASRVEEMLDRPKSAERAISTVSKEVTYVDERHAQSDTEQVTSNQEKKPKRPKRISRKCQTNENVFRRMEKEQQRELRATEDNEKIVQTQRSQLRPRRKSPKRNIPVFLSNDSFRAEDVLPNQFFQSRRNISKSSAVLRTFSPPTGKLLILRPTLPFHHTDAVNVQRVCLQYAIDLIPSDRTEGGALTNRRIKTTAIKPNDKYESLPMIRASSPVTNSTSAKSATKDKSTAQKPEDQSNYRKNPGAH